MKSLWEKPDGGFASPAGWTMVMGLFLAGALILLATEGSDLSPAVMGEAAGCSLLLLFVGVPTGQIKRWVAIMDLGDPKLGSRVEVPIAEVADGYYTIGGADPVGIFSLKAVTRELY